ncbi:MAG: succinylglutamate desuccinylase/aspartoacylase family protein [Candidatus Heimdallarchaeota archaeon]
MKAIAIGSAKSEPGKLTYGSFDALDLPTGTAEKIPIMICQGLEEGPTFFLTANVHGNELTGIGVIHELGTQELARELKGTVVAFPTISPSGLRRADRSPAYDARDPNRLFPEGRFAIEEELDEDEKHPKLYEQVAQKIYGYCEQYADYHLDFHNHSIRSVPYAILDRVFFKDEAEKADAERLSGQQREMVEAFGVMITADFPAKKYLKLKYYRTLSGATLNTLRIPAFTVELGANTVIFPNIVSGSVKATRNVLKWAGMLPGAKEEITEFEVPKPPERLQRIDHPRAKQAGIIKFLVDPGEQVNQGQPIASFTDILGRPHGDGFIRTEYDGYMIALRSAMTVYANETIAEMGIRDEEPTIAQMPSKKK